MAFTTTPGYPQAIINIAKQILPADTTSKVTIYTAPINGASIQALGITTTDTVARVMSFYLTISAVDYLIGSIAVAARAGDITSIAAATMLTNSLMGNYLSFDPEGNRVLRLQNGAILKAALNGAATAAKEFNIVGYGVSY
jgi:hypothetical protein